jgi:hypothetical protein
LAKTSVNQRVKRSIKNPRTWILIFLYIVVSVLFENTPGDMLLYLLPEGIGLMLVGMFYEMYMAKNVSKAIGRFFIYLILIGLTAFLLMFPLSFTIFLNSSQLPELNLFYSETAEAIFIYLSSHESLWSLVSMPFEVFGTTSLIVIGVSMATLLLSKIKAGSMFTGDTHVPYELKYVSFMCLGFLLGTLPAFLIGIMIPGSFPFVLVIVMRFYTEMMISSNEVGPQN